jgi:hypothetical protein
MSHYPQPSYAAAHPLPTEGSRLRFFRSLYARHHTHRFDWLRQKIASLEKPSISILEIGCADARSLDYVPVHINRYYGLDAGWRSGVRNGKIYGLEAARCRFAHRKNFTFQQSVHYADLKPIREKFDIEILLETFEYLETSQLESYVRLLGEKLDERGCVLSTMPNEKGFPLLVKGFGSKISGVRRSEYNLREFLNAVVGRMDRVPRAERGRKGFDYEAVARLMARYFHHVHLEPVGGFGLPIALSPNVGLVASQAPLPCNSANLRGRP